MTIKNSCKNGAKRMFKFVLSHALIGGVIGVAVFGYIHYRILVMRNALECGFFCKPELITGTEMAWYFIGISFMLIAIGLGGFIGHKRSKK